MNGVNLITLPLFAIIPMIQSLTASAYPIDAYEATGIGRLQAAQRIESGTLNGRKQPVGGLLNLEQVDLRLLDYKDMELPEVDSSFTRQIVALLGDQASRYAISVLDMSDPEHPRFAEHAGDVRRNPGSVGKLLVGTAIFQMLADLYPNDIEKRQSIMHDTVIRADDFIVSDSHNVRFWDRQAERLIRRPLKIGDEGSFMEFMDWMMSASSNAAAATMMKHAMLIKHFGLDYPVDHQTGIDLFKQMPRKELRALYDATALAPVTKNGLDLERFRQGSFFTYKGKSKVPGTSSYATSHELMKFLLRLEQGRIVDTFSSRELKRLIYITERRIRYASSPALRKSAVYFKSGSWYKCEPEAGFKCGKYRGNVRNLMNSIAIIESPADKPRIHYIVSLMSNVLRRNSALDHQTLATRIHRLIEKAHPMPTE